MLIYTNKSIRAHIFVFPYLICFIATKSTLTLRSRADSWTMSEPARERGRQSDIERKTERKKVSEKETGLVLFGIGMYFMWPSYAHQYCQINKCMAERVYKSVNIESKFVLYIHVWPAGYKVFPMKGFINKLLSTLLRVCLLFYDVDILYLYFVFFLKFFCLCTIFMNVCFFLFFCVDICCCCWCCCFAWNDEIRKYVPKENIPSFV